MKQKESPGLFGQLSPVQDRCYKIIMNRYKSCKMFPGDKKSQGLAMLVLNGHLGRDK